MSFREPGDLRFASRFGGWNRLEPRSRQRDLGPGLAARTADPLWMLGRQWQLGELAGEDAASPVQVSIEYEEIPVTQVQLGSAPFTPVGAVPLEALVERERVPWDWRMRIRAGQHHERLRGGAGGALSSEYALPRPGSDAWNAMDPATQRFVGLMRDVPDGRLLFNALPANPGGYQLAFKQWCERLHLEPAASASAWRPEHLDYAFRMRAGAAEFDLRADSYRNGALDWDAFDLEPRAAATRADPAPTGTPRVKSVQLTPTRVGFAGQPAARWWEFEDAAVDFGALDVSRTDIGKMVLMEFTLTFGDDWFIVPLTAPTNHFIRIRSFEVRDTFGQRTTVRPARTRTGPADQRWDLFALSRGDRDVADGESLFVPPVVDAREESPVLEEVRFARDEDANVVFAIEHTLQNGLGEPVGGGEAYRNTAASASPPTSAPAAAPDPPAPVSYLLATSVPSHWIPFVAVEPASGQVDQVVRLQRARFVDADTLAPLAAPRTRLLSAGDPSAVHWIFEEAVGREGVRVQLRRQRVRGPDGETYVWFGRQVRVGRGEARSGLRFDATTSGGGAA